MHASTALIIDTETTGLTAPEVIEVAWKEIKDPITQKGLHNYIARHRPDKPIELGALATHHIMDEELGHLPRYDYYAFCKTPPVEVEYLIGHNIDYDWEVLGKPPYKRICTLALARTYCPELDSHKLGALMYHFRRQDAKEMLQSAHSAAADIAFCEDILWQLLKIIHETHICTTWTDLWEISESARVPSVMPFGKHKGTPLAFVPSDYVGWLRRQPDVDPYLMQGFRNLGRF